MYMVWRYQQLYVYQSTYRSFGQMWTFYAHRLVAIFALTILFTGVMFLIKRAYVQGGITIICGELLMLMFNIYITSKYDSVVHEVPVALLEAIPRANLDKQQFLPPSLRKDEEGWFLEHGKVRYEYIDMVYDSVTHAISPPCRLGFSGEPLAMATRPNKLLAYCL